MDKTKTIVYSLTALLNKPSVNIWIYFINNSLWDQLTENFSKEHYNISSNENIPIQQNDLVLFYKNFLSKSGFVALCEINSSFKINKDKIRIFNDSTLNVYYTSIKTLYIFEKSIPLSNIKVIDIINFKKTYYNQKKMFCKIENILGKKLINNIIQNYIIKKDLNYTDNEDVPMIIKGHIPILFEPCNNYKWYGSNNYEESIQMFKDHYINCTKCIKTNNNDEELYPYINKSALWFANINAKETNTYLNLYHNLQPHTFVLLDEDKKYTHMYIVKINNCENVYNNCLLIIW
jgi:hypothetical protein